MTARWTENDVPDQTGRTVVITGASSGIGLATARLFARRHAQVVLACRDPERTAEAERRILAETPGATLRTVPLDLTSQASVRRAAAQLREEHPRIDLLINNAGGTFRHQRTTEDGFETTFATNHLGPFALTGLVLPSLLETPGSRVVTVSSNGHKRGTMQFDDLQLSARYRFGQAYFQSKVANLLFAYELQRRLAGAGAETVSVAAHPGNARTRFGAELLPVRIFTSQLTRPFTWWLLQEPEVSALATVRAAVDPDVVGGEYFGPDGRNEWTGNPVRVESTPLTHDAATQRRLWAESERLTGVVYPLADADRLAPRVP